MRSHRHELHRVVQQENLRALLARFGGDDDADTSAPAPRRMLAPVQTTTTPERMAEVTRKMGNRRLRGR